MIEIEPFVEQTAGGLIENEKRGKGDARARLPLAGMPK